MSSDYMSKAEATCEDYNYKTFTCSEKQLEKTFAPYKEDFLEEMNALHAEFLAELKVKEATLLGYTGTTGQSTGIHLHLGLRKSNSKTWIDPHAYDYQEDSYDANNREDKSIEELANEVIEGKWGNGSDRKTSLTKAGYDYNDVQNKVNELLSSSSKIVKYTVKKGDTLSSIAKKYNTTWNKIYDDNKNIIGNNPDLIYEGQELVIK